MNIASTLEEYVAIRSGVFKLDTTAIFIPYIVYLIDRNKYDSLEDADRILTDFATQYNFTLDEMVFRNLLSHIIQSEFVYQDLASKTFVSNTQKIRTHSFSEFTKEALSSFESLKRKCNEYLTTEIGIPAPSEDELTDAVFHLIQSVCDTATYGGEGGAKTTANTAYKVALNDFVLYAEANCPEIVDEINKLAVSDILWRVVSSGEEHNISFRNNASIFLDTRFVLRLMGLEGEYWERLTKTLVVQIKERGGRLVLFDHVKTEIEQIIRNAQSICKSSKFDIAKASRVAKEFYRNPAKYTDVYISELLYDLLHNSEDAYNFVIEEHDYDSETDQFQIDYHELKDNVIQEYKKANPQFDESECDDSIEVDVRSITMCYRARGDFSTDRVDDITVLFLTTNTAILRAAQNTKGNEVAAGKMPIGMTAEYLSTFLSLGERIDYLQSNRVLMLAYCYGAVQPTKTEIQEFVQALNTERKAKKYSKDKVSYLKQSQTFARLYTINEKLPVTYRKTLEELEHTRVNEIRKENETLQQKVEDREVIIEGLRGENTNLQKEVTRLTQAIEARDNAEQDQRNKANEFAETVIQKCQKYLTTAIGFIITAIPFVLDRLIPAIKWDWIASFWTNTGSTINLLVFITGCFVLLISWIMKCQKIQQGLKSVLVFCYLFIKSNKAK
ncbi:MAG: hypothetical protein KBS46_01585 [Clostridiales bacterium]|nr:hypothetical protein [Candidatus Apopatocola equi]